VSVSNGASLAQFPDSPLLFTTRTMAEPQHDDQSGTRARVLVTEKISQEGLNLLRETADIDERKGLSPEEVAAIVANYEALIVRSETKVTSELLMKATKLKVVARAGVGVDNVG
jgi:D-3-phosphoglycerate dehydrogenase